MTWPGVGRLLRERPCSASLLLKELQYAVQTPASTLPNALARGGVLNRLPKPFRLCVALGAGAENEKSLMYVICCVLVR